MASIDLHVDYPWQTFRAGSALDLTLGDDCLQVDFPRMKKGGLDSFVAPLFLSDKVQDRLGPEKSWNAIKNQARIVSGYSKCHLAVEGGRLLGEKLERLATLAVLKPVYITLTHNRNTSWADSATDSIQHNGLTARGKSFVKEIQSHNILVDLSHSSDQTVLDTIKLTKSPVIASHSGVAALVNHPRNLSDFLIKEIVATGGIIGIPYATKFVGDRAGVALAIDHIAQLTGSTRHLAIGSDLDGAETVIDDVQAWSEVLQPLLDIGYTDENLTAIKGGNFRRLLDEVNGTN